MRWLRSRQFFVFIVVLFVFEAVWIALSARYPMAFDEDFHLGIIQIYAHHLSPFFISQPAGADSFGAVARDPSYLYHYLMSFPWRLITALTHDFTVQVIFMRLINISFFAGSLVVFRKVMLKTKLSPALVNIALLFFVLTPLVPQVAAQINYDNLLMPLTAWSLLLTLQFVQHLETKHQIDWRLLIVLFSVCLLTSLVKYAFLPIFAAIILYVAWQLYQSRHAYQASLWQMFHKNYRRLSSSAKILLLLTLVVSSSLFIERYGVNTVRYGTPIPECNQVLSRQQCAAYGAWNRNYQFELAKVSKTDWNPLPFSIDWARKLGFNLMFALNGQTSGYKVGKPLLLPRLAARTIAYGSPILILVFWKKLFSNKVLRFLMFASALYLAALWLQNYEDYLHLGQQVAVQGRYLLPVLLFMYLAVGAAFGQLFKSKPDFKLALTAVALLCFIAGGGVLTFIIHSDQTWYWPNSNVIKANQGVQRVLDPIIPDSHYEPS